MRPGSGRRTDATLGYDEPRLAVGFLLQPVVSFVLGFLLFPLVNYSSRVAGEGQASSLVDGALAFALGTGIVGGLVTLVFAWPAVLWLGRRGPLSRRTVLLGGLMIGNAPAILAAIVWTVTAVLMRVNPADQESLDLMMTAFIVARGVIIGSTMGVVGAWVLWFVAHGTPCRSTQP